jgi:hypothetical protein
MEPFLLALLAHGAIGGADVVLNHELIAKIPSRANAGLEEALHCGRELVFGVLFLALAWFEWHGAAALAIAALLLVELTISGVDTVIEVDTRTLPVSERILHYFLFTNMGVVLTLLGQKLLAWWQLPTQVLRADHGVPGMVLSGLALLALAWSVRDGRNVLQRLRTRAASAAAAPQKA